MRNALNELGLEAKHLVNNQGQATSLGRDLVDYFSYRAHVLDNVVRLDLMDVHKAAKLFMSMKARLKPQCPLPMNKQKENKKAEAYFTCIINMLIETNSNGLPCNYNPYELTTVTRNGEPLRTLARRVDGAFPSTVNPVAVWEIKEYYYTTTFGSRVADGVYESLLDGMELEELRTKEQIDVKHYLMVDDYNTWWNMGRSYLCRIVDMVHMGYVDEALFGSEVIRRLPQLVKSWTKGARSK